MVVSVIPQDFSPAMIFEFVHHNGKLQDDGSKGLWCVFPHEKTKFIYISSKNNIVSTIISIG